MFRQIRSARIVIAFVVIAFAVSLPTQAQRQHEIGARVDALLARMTLEEKVGQVNQFDVTQKHLDSAIAAGKVGSVLNAVGAEETNRWQHIAMEKSRLHIPLLFGYDVIHGYRTIFPIPLGIASTWDPAAAEEAARIAATEASAAGVRWTFAPMVDIARDPRWGRISEGAGEDPTLGSAMAAAYVRGFQGEHLSDPASVAACAKHYVGYGAAEGGRDYNTVDMSERRLREVYLPPFKAAADAGALTFMSSFNTLNGVPASANPFTLRKILKGEWNFPGFVVSDWNAISELIQHGVAADAKSAARLALNAGIDTDMVSGSYLMHAAELVRSGAVPMSVLNDAVRRVLRVKFQLGLFDHPYVEPAKENESQLTPENLAAARKIAQKSMVLLKNEGDVLPLTKSIGAIALMGPLADSKIDMLGNWYAQGKAVNAVTVLEGVRAKTGGSTRILYSKGVEVEGQSVDGIADAVAAAKQADVAVLVLGEKGEMSGEAASRTSIDLPGAQQNLLEAVAATGKPVVLVLMNGRPLTIPWAAEHVPAILETWFPGVQGGNAVADILFGDANPSGKLPVTFPRHLGQVPIYYSHLNTGRPVGVDPKYYSGYIDSPTTPLFPFGYGLSYTKFSYSDVRSAPEPDANGTITASVEVKNAGGRVGEEVVELYVHGPVSSVARPVRELKAFQRVKLEPGESRRVEFTIQAGQLAFWDATMRYRIAPGSYTLSVGPSSAEGLQTAFKIPNQFAATWARASFGATPSKRDITNRAPINRTSATISSASPVRRSCAADDNAPMQ